ncbi:MAG: hypothetical protein H0W86_12435 [Armatimonadetes bacterium]|nr:hypothetical protein [Armatimonadota bacterium]
MGFWNRFGFGIGPHHMQDTAGQTTGATMTALSADGQYSGGGFLFEGNTGDYARLLNDAADVGTIVDGGGKTYTFTGLVPGLYEVYTYAVNIWGVAIDTPVTIPEAVGPMTQVVTGPMPGNGFEFLVTHSIHTVDLALGDSFRIIFKQPPFEETIQCVNGFQVVPVPETETRVLVILGCLYLVIVNRSRVRLYDQEQG